MKRNQFFGELLPRPPILFILLLFCGLLSCKKKILNTEISPIQVPVLKSVQTIVELPERAATKGESSTKQISSEQFFEYSDGKVSKITSNLKQILTDGTLDYSAESSVRLVNPSEDE